MPALLAVAAHPDDIEFVMCGTMLLLQQRGWDLHYMNLADGRRGSTQLSPDQCAQTRLREAQAAAEVLGATFHPPIGRDFELAYTTEMVQRVAAVVRKCKATIVLTHAPIDYMEDHEVTCRLAVSAAFAHGMPNLETIPPQPPYFEPVTVYHAQPHGNRTPTGERVHPDYWVDTLSVIDRKRTALECHRSQHEWLDQSQGMSSYVQTMLELSSEAGRLSGKWLHAEGWRRREHWGFCGPNDDPLQAALADVVAKGRSRDA